MPESAQPRTVWPKPDGTVSPRPNWPEAEPGQQPAVPEGTKGGPGNVNLNKDRNRCPGQPPG